MAEVPIITITDQHVVNCVFDRVTIDKNRLQERIDEAVNDFLSKYPQFTISETRIFDISYGKMKCVIDLQLK